MDIHTLMFGWEYPPHHLGGLGVACQGLVQGLLGNGVQVTLVLPHPSNTAETADMHVITPTETLLKTVRVLSFLSPYDGHVQFRKRAANMPRELTEIYGADLPQAVLHFTAMSVEMTKDTNPDIVHCHDWMTYGAAAQAAAYHDVPLVAHIHATELDRTHFHPNEWIFAAERRGLLAADRIIAVSNYTKQILTTHYGIAPDKISVVHNGSATCTDTRPPVIASQAGEGRPPMILFLGRLTIQKGPMQFLDMAAKVHQLRPDVQFIMAGEGGMIGEIMRRACELRLENVVAFAGKVSNDEAKRLYRQASCFVMPSLSEPFGLVALEAIAHGTPAIISKQSGVSEVVGHAFKVDFWDTEKMADCALTILRDAPLAQQLTSEAPRVLQHLTWINQASQVRSIYQDLLQ